MILLDVTSPRDTNTHDMLCCCPLELSSETYLPPSAFFVLLCAVVSSLEFSMLVPSRKGGEDLVMVMVLIILVHYK